MTHIETSRSGCPRKTLLSRLPTGRARLSACKSLPSLSSSRTKKATGKHFPSKKFRSSTGTGHAMRCAARATMPLGKNRRVFDVIAPGHKSPAPSMKLRLSSRRKTIKTAAFDHRRTRKTTETEIAGGEIETGIETQTATPTETLRLRKEPTPIQTPTAQTVSLTREGQMIPFRVISFRA